MLPTIAREDDVVVMIDQRKLPAQEIYVRCKTAAEVARAIKTIVADSDMRAELSRRGRLQAEQFSLARYRERVAALYERLG